MVNSSKPTPRKRNGSNINSSNETKRRGLNQSDVSSRIPRVEPSLQSSRIPRVEKQYSDRMARINSGNTGSISNTGSNRRVQNSVNNTGRNRRTYNRGTAPIGQTRDVSQISLANPVQSSNQIKRVPTARERLGLEEHNGDTYSKPDYEGRKSSNRSNRNLNSGNSRIQNQNQAPKQRRSNNSSNGRIVDNTTRSNSRSKQSAPKHGRSNTSSIAAEQIANNMWSSTNQNDNKRNRQQQNSRGHQQVQKNGAISKAGITKTKNFKGPNIGSILKVVCVLLIAFVLIGGIDSLLSANKIYNGVKVGNVDLSGKTIDEATSLIQAEYGSRVTSNSAVFYKDENAKNNPQESDYNSSIQDQISYEESLSSRTQWTVNANTVEATFDAESYANKAYQVGRDNGGVLSRIAAQFLGNSITPECSFNESSLATLREELTKAVGQMRVNFDIEMVDAVAQVTEGHDGDEVTQEWLTNKLNETFINSTSSNGYVLETEHLALQVSRNAAEECAKKVNASIAHGVTLTYENSVFNATREQVASWISTEIEEGTFSNTLKPIISETKAKSSILQNLHSTFDKDTLVVTFNKSDNGTITVSSNASGSVPEVSKGIEELNKSYFTNTEPSSAPIFELGSTDIPETMSLEDAQNYGLVTTISSYTTTYASGAEQRNHNIHTAADYLSYSICSANDGIWSFNNIAGEATEERGYQAAHAIVSGELVDAIGGGICQVATTVYNAVYDAGYPIVERHNHTMYISSYPSGRDAAIAYPTYDLRWKNDTSSDVLLVMSYTDSSVTCTLYGVDPEYQVTTQTGEWEKGKEYTTTYKTDDTIKSGVEYVETVGTDGSQITVIRTVKDKNGTILHQDTFDSVYQPVNEVIVKGSA